MPEGGGISRHFDESYTLITELVVDERTDLIAYLTELRQDAQLNDLIAEAGRKVLLNELIQMIKHEAGSRTGDDIEDVHDMRVAIRRMRSTLRLLEPYFKPKSIVPQMQSLRKVATSLGSVRDLDVLMSDLQTYSAAQPEATQTALASVLALMEKRRTSARERLNNTFDKGSYQRFVKDFAGFLTSPGKGAREVDSDDIHPVQLRHVLPEMVYRHLGSVRAYDSVIADMDIPTLHALRIECKRLRYTVSLFRELLGTGILEFIEELKVIQDSLGRVNDLADARDRLGDLLKQFGPKLNADAQTALSDYLIYLETEQTTDRAGVMALWVHFNTKKVQRLLANAIAGL